MLVVGVRERAVRAEERSPHHLRWPSPSAHSRLCAKVLRIPSALLTCLGAAGRADTLLRRSMHTIPRARQTIYRLDSTYLIMS